MNNKQQQDLRRNLIDSTRDTRTSQTGDERSSSASFANQPERRQSLPTSALPGLFPASMRQLNPLIGASQNLQVNSTLASHYLGGLNPTEVALLQQQTRQQQAAAAHRLQQIREASAEALAIELELRAIQRAQEAQLVQRLGLAPSYLRAAAAAAPLYPQPAAAIVPQPLPAAAAYAALPPTIGTNPLVGPGISIPVAASLPPADVAPEDLMGKISSTDSRKRPREDEEEEPTAKIASLKKGDSDVSTDDSDSTKNLESMTQMEQWGALYKQLCKYRKIHGHCLVPQHTADNLRLARWVKRQRYQYKLMKEGKLTNMTKDRVKKLKAIGFVWDSHSATWEERLGELKEYKKVNGHCNVPITYKENRKLAAWVKCQRRQYKLLVDGEPSNMTLERLKTLEDVGFEWKVRQRK